MAHAASDDSSLTAEVMALINDLDPHGFFAEQFGVPETEYMPEAQAIAEVLRSGGDLDVSVVDQIWVYWFSQPLTELKSLEDVQEFVVSCGQLRL